MPKLRCVTALLAFAALFGAACSGGEDDAIATDSPTSSDSQAPPSSRPAAPSIDTSMWSANRPASARRSSGVEFRGGSGAAAPRFFDASKTSNAGDREW